MLTKLSIRGTPLVVCVISFVVIWILYGFYSLLFNPTLVIKPGQVWIHKLTNVESRRDSVIEVKNHNVKYITKYNEIEILGDYVFHTQHKLIK